MKKQRFTEEQIIAVLKEQGEPSRTVRKQLTSAAGTGFQKRRFITGKPNTAAWTSPRRSG